MRRYSGLSACWQALLGGLLLLMVLPQSAAAQAALMRFDEAAQDGAAPWAVRVNRVLAQRLASGDSLAVDLGGHSRIVYEVSQTGHYFNGDRFVHARGQAPHEQLSLSLTLGPQSLFAWFNSPDSTYQLRAHGSGDDIAGWLQPPASLSGEPGEQLDYWLPARPGTALAAAPATAPQLAFSATPVQPASAPSAASGSGLNSDNLRLSQSLSPAPVLVGDSVTATVTLENISTEPHTGVSLEIYFFLENSSLAAAPAFCREQLSLSLQKVLYCELGDLAPGASSEFSYAFSTSEASRPTVMTTLLSGSVRLDDYVHVVQDVRRDSDGDGISDFNERLLATDPDNAASVDHGTTVIDVLTLYTPGTEALYPHGVETRINQLLGVANQIYADSGVAINLRPVYHGRIDYPDKVDMETALNSLLGRSHEAFDGVDELRNRYGADLVMLMRPLEEESARCGLAPVGGYGTRGDFSAATEREYAFSVIGIDCPDDVVVAHELGHNMGLTHSWREDGTGGTFDFATGHGVDGVFASVMALPAAFGVEGRLGRFSSPEGLCLGVVCGRPEGSADAADAVLTLNTVRHQIAAFSEQRVPDLPELILTATSGRQTSAHISVAASTDNGLSFTDQVSVGDRVDVFADIALDPAHVGSEGSVHVLIRTEGQALFQLDEIGRLVVWDGSVEDLRAAVASGPLRSLERLDILRDFRFDERAAGQVIEFFVAYQLDGFSDVVYTAEPLRLRVSAD